MDPTPYRENRRRFLARLEGAGAAAVIPTAPHRVRNNDSTYTYRPSSDFWYLTGFGEPGACLVLLPGVDGAPARSILFLRERDRERETWDGRRLGTERAPEALGVDEARDIEALWDDLPALLTGVERIAWRLGDDTEGDRRMVETFTALRGRARRTVRPPVALLDTAPLLHEQRVVKTEAELERMRRAADVTARAHRDLMGLVRPGRNEREVRAFLDHRYLSEGSTGAAYEHICAGGANACVLHYVENSAELADGDLILVDSGAEWDYYAADITRTFPVSGRFTEAQRAIYEVVLAAEIAAIEAIRPGAPFDAVHDAALRVIVAGLCELGLLEGSVEEAIEAGAHRRYFMHQTSHWLGLDVHDCGAYADDGAPRALEPGMVLTVEPGIYVAPDDDSVDARWRGIGVRIEDDVVVTRDGHEVLTAAAPKTPEEVEEACRADGGVAAG